MSYVGRWDTATCPACGAAPHTPCDYTPSVPHSGRTTHVERQQAVLRQQLQVMYDNQRSVACPSKACGAGPGEMCNTREINEYGVVSHKARIFAANKKEKGE